MINFDDHKNFLFDFNFLGQGDDSSIVPSNQGVDIVAGKYEITYSFLRSFIDINLSEYYTSGSDEAEHILTHDDANTSYNQSIENAMRTVFAPSNAQSSAMLFQDVADITFKETTIGANDDNGDGTIQSTEITTGLIAIGQLETEYFQDSDVINISPQTTAFSIPYNPGTTVFDDISLNHGDIFINSEHTFWTQSDASILKTQAFKVLLEEVTHSLGVDVKLPGIEDGFYDNQKYTVTARQGDHAPDMGSLINDAFSVAPHTLQIMDIAAIQEIYGRNYEKLAGNTEITLSGMNAVADKDSAFLYTIWDGGGSADVLNISESAISAEIDLRQGRFSSMTF